MANIETVQSVKYNQTQTRQTSKASGREKTDFIELLGAKAAVDKEKKTAQADEPKTKEKTEDKNKQEQDEKSVSSEASVSQEMVQLFEQDTLRAVPVVQTELSMELSAEPLEVNATAAMLQTETPAETGQGELLKEMTENVQTAPASAGAFDAKEAVKPEKAVEDLMEAQREIPKESSVVQAVQTRETEEASKTVQPVSQEENGRNAAEETPELMSPTNTMETKNTVSSTEQMPKAEEPVRTTEAKLPEDVAKAIGERMPAKNGELTIELEPKSLGKIIVKVVYQAEQASVALMSSNPKTLEILSRDAAGMAGIIEERTGQETVVFTPQQDPMQDNSGKEHQSEDRRQEQQRDGQKEQTESFMQQLRLGLI